MVIQESKKSKSYIDGIMFLFVFWFHLVNVNYKVKFRFLIKHHSINVHGSGGIAPSIFISALDEIEWSASRPIRITPGERAPAAHWKWEMGRPLIRSGRSGERNVRSGQASSTDSPVVQTVGWSLNRVSHPGCSECLEPKRTN